jgi:hypothetical protein
VERTQVYLEVGVKRVFACAVDWPGWCRTARTEDAALESLIAYAPRYAAAVGPSFVPGELQVIGRLAGNGTTDFGAPDARGPWDDEPVEPREAERLAGVLVASWEAFDGIVAAAPAALRRGPRGGGRDRDAIAAHVQEAERSYGRTIGVRLPPRTPWPEQREAFTAALRSGAVSGPWPVRYAARRFAWHVLDHAWEIEDKVPG